MTVQKIKSGRVTSVTADQFIGDKGQLFYNEDQGDLRISDGVTPGGNPILVQTGNSGGASGDGDPITTITCPLQLTESWQDTGITGQDLSTGTYILQLYANDTGAGGHNIQEYYSGTLSWYRGATDSDQELPTDEIQLHRTGGSQDGGLYLRTLRSAHYTYLSLQIFSNTPTNGLSNYVFKFRKML